MAAALQYIAKHLIKLNWERIYAGKFAFVIGMSYGWKCCLSSAERHIMKLPVLQSPDLVLCDLCLSGCCCYLKNARKIIMGKIGHDCQLRMQRIQGGTLWMSCTKPSMFTFAACFFATKAWRSQINLLLSLLVLRQLRLCLISFVCVRARLLYRARLLRLLLYRIREYHQSHMSKKVNVFVIFPWSNPWNGLVKHDASKLTIK